VEASIALESELAHLLRHKRNLPEREKTFNRSVLSWDVPIDVNNEDIVSKVKEDLLNFGKEFKRRGDSIRERAVILASINYLATNVPSCVLEHLGREIQNFPSGSQTPVRDALARSKSLDCSRSLRRGLVKKNSSSYSLDCNNGIQSLPYAAPFQAVILFSKSLLNHHLSLAFSLSTSQLTLLGSQLFPHGTVQKT